MLQFHSILYYLLCYNKYSRANHVKL